MSEIKKFLSRFVYAPVKNKRLSSLIKYKPARVVINALILIIAVSFPLVCYTVVEYVHFKTMGQGFILFLQNRTSVVIAMITMFYLFWIVLLLLTKKAAIANAVLGVVSIAFSITNYFKYVLTGDFFYPWDMLQAGNLGKLTGFVTQGIPVIIILAFVALLIYMLLPALTNLALPVKAYIRVPLAIIIVLIMAFSVNTPSKINKYLSKHSMGADQAALQASNYVDNGFVGGFTINVLSLNVEMPDGYSEQTVDDILSDYTYIEATDEFTSPDIIVILSESFWDPKLLPGSSFYDTDGNEIDPISNFEEIASRDGVISGMMANTALGGGTVRPEFEVLTGLSTDYLPSGSIPYQYVDEQTDSFPALYKSLGYTTYGVHSYLPAFYARNTGYPKIGIDNLNFEQEIYDYSDSNPDWQWTLSGKHISDMSLMEYIEHLLDDNTDSPAFVMGISMEAHQPYETKYSEDELEVIAYNDSLSEDALLPFRNFTMAMYNADKALAQLVDYIDSRENDTILVYFGDHLPTLGTNYAAYVQSGMIADTQRSGENDRFVTQRTPFLIYANFELSESQLLHEGTDNEIASYNLLNAASELIGAPRTQYMQWLTDFGLAYPGYNVRVTPYPSDDLKEWIYKHQTITYDRTVGKKYSHGK